MGITLQQAKQLKHGDIIYSNRFLNASKEHPIRWRISGQVKQWKRDPDRLQIPVKHGLYDHAYLCHGKIADSIRMNAFKITLELEDFELDEDIAKEKCLL